MKKTLRIASLLIPFAPSVHAEWVDWVFDANLESRYNTNINQASRDSEVESDFSFHPAATFGRVFQLGDRTRLFAGGRVGGTFFVRFEDLNALDGTGEVSLLHKFGLGDAPWLRLYATGGYQDVVAIQRSGARYTLGGVVGKRFSPRFDAKFEYTYTRRYGGDGPAVVANQAINVFDQQYHLITLQGSYLVTEDLLFEAGFSYRRGDFVSNAQESRFAVLATNNFEAVARDQVFGGWVYRIQGNGYEPFVRLNYGLGDYCSLDLGYRFRFVEGGGLDYRDHGVSAVLLFSY